MKEFFILFGIVVFTFACNTNKNTHTTNNKTMIPTGLSVSNGFRMFWAELVKDSDGFLLNNYTPSAKLISKYSLQLQNEEYTISGFFETTPDFNKDIFLVDMGSLTTYSAKLSSFTVPITKIPEIVHVKGIDNLDIRITIPIKK